MRIVIGFRAAIALAATLVITFTRPDTAALGLAIFAGFGLAQGLGTVAISFSRKATSSLQKVAPQAAISLVAAIAAGLAELCTLIFVVLNPEPLNASGFLGAYLALSAVHQGIWAASPSKAD